MNPRPYVSHGAPSTTYPSLTCGVWACPEWRSTDCLTSTSPCPWLPLYSRFYSKMAAVEASTAHTVCPTAMYTLQPLQRCRALQLYSRSTVYILYTTPQVTPLCLGLRVRSNDFTRVCVDFPAPCIGFCSPLPTLVRGCMLLYVDKKTKPACSRPRR